MLLHVYYINFYFYLKANNFISLLTCSSLAAYSHLFRKVLFRVCCASLQLQPPLGWTESMVDTWSWQSIHSFYKIHWDVTVRVTLVVQVISLNCMLITWLIWTISVKRWERMWNILDKHAVCVGSTSSVLRKPVQEMLLMLAKEKNFKRQVSHP